MAQWRHGPGKIIHGWSLVLVSNVPKACPSDRQLPVTGAGVRIRELDGLRGLAILLVVVWHYLVNGNDAEPGSLHQLFNTTFSLTWVGVDVFFVLSGFLIGGILIDRRGTSGYFSGFWRRRIARLLPLYLLLIAAYLIALPVAAYLNPGHKLWLFDEADRFPLWSYLLYVQNLYMAKANHFGPNWLAVSWSLAVEEQFYLLAPFLLCFMPLRRLPVVLASLAVATLFIRNLYLAAGGSTVGAYVLLPVRWEGLLIGILLAYYHRQPAVRAWLETHPRWLLSILGLLLSGFGLLLVAQQGMFSPFMMVVGYSYLALTAAALLAVVLYVRWPLVNWLFANAILAELGVISYGVYLLHQPVHGLASLALLGQSQRLQSPQDVFVALGSFALTMAIARLSWRHIEKPIIDLAHRPAGKQVRWLSALPVPFRQTSR